MKTIITGLGIFAYTFMNTFAFAQCPNTTGNYEFAITNDARIITIKVRNTTATIRSSYVDPAINGNFVGLVFGIKWSAKSDIVLNKNNSVAPFDIRPSGNISQKNGFSFQSYGDEAKELPILSKEWLAGAWNVIATIPFTGSLANGDKFELTECGFDMTTNPYFAQMDMQGNYGQFAPNLFRNDQSAANLAITDAVIVYPNPTRGDLFVDVSSSAITRATFKVMDMTGKVVKTIQSDLVEGLNKIIINVNDISNGMYMLKVLDGRALNYAQTFNKQ